MEYEELNNENKKIVDIRLKYVLDEEYYNSYMYYLLDYLSDDEKFRVLIQIENMAKSKWGEVVCLK